MTAPAQESNKNCLAGSGAFAGGVVYKVPRPFRWYPSSQDRPEDGSVSEYRMRRDRDPLNGLLCFRLFDVRVDQISASFAAPLKLEQDAVYDEPISSLGLLAHQRRVGQAAFAMP